MHNRYRASRKKNPQEAWGAILRYCSKSERCVFDVEKKLRSWGLSPDKSTGIIKKLLQDKWVDEARYARAFVHDKLHINNWGKLKIRSQLFAKNISSGLIDEAFLGITETSYLDIIRELLQKRKEMGEKDLQRNIRYIMSRGFEYEKVQQAIDRK